MSSDTLLFDPEFEAILRDVASDPRSSLLRVKRPEKLGELFDSYSPISAQAAGLTSAERHLVQVHRNEVAWLLRHACLIKLLEGPKSRQIVGRHTAPDRKVTLLSSAEMQRRVRNAHDGQPQSEALQASLVVLSTCVADPHGATPSIADLAAAAFRLEPTDSARVIAGLDLAMRDEPRASLQLMSRLIVSSPTTHDCARAWECVGLCRAALGDLVGAHAAIKRACEQGESGLLNCRTRFVLELQLGLEREALESARVLDDLLTPREPAVDWFVEALLDRRRSGEWSPTPKALRLAFAWRDRLGSVGGRLLDVLI